MVVVVGGGVGEMGWSEDGILDYGFTRFADADASNDRFY